MDPKIIDVFLGKANKKTHSYLVIVILGLLAICWGIAQSLFEDEMGKYSILRNHISNQGNPDNTPAWFLFTISVCIAAILLFSHFLYFFNHFRSKDLKIMNISLYLSIICCFLANIGFFFVGIFNENIPVIHEPAAKVAFIGYGLGILLLLPVLIYKYLNKHPWPKKREIIIIYGIIAILVVVLILVSSFSITLTQWLGFFSIFLWILGIFYIIPQEEIEKNLQ